MCTPKDRGGGRAVVFSILLVGARVVCFRGGFVPVLREVSEMGGEEHWGAFWPQFFFIFFTRDIAIEKEKT